LITEIKIPQNIKSISKIKLMQNVRFQG